MLARQIGDMAARIEAVEVMCRFMRVDAEEFVTKIIESNPEVGAAARAALLDRRERPARIDAETVVDFLQERVEYAPNGPGIRASEVYQVFCSWFRSRNKDVRTPPSQKSFGGLLSGFERRGVNGVVFLKNFKWRKHR